MLSESIRCLGSAERLLSTIDDNQFTRLPSCFTASVGTHLRHVVNHYDALLDGLDQHPIDYDRRERNQDCEHNRSVMIMRLREVRGRLATFERSAAGNKRLEVVIRPTPDDSRRSVAVSTLARELGFLHSHTIHHFALIAASLRSQSVEVGEEFGVAPSTLRFQRVGDSA